MTSTKLTGSEKRALLLWVLAGIVGLFFAQRYFFRAFPEASVDFKVSRAESVNHAKTFLADLGENVDGYRSSVEFSVEEDEKVYLERELGLQQANQLAASQINLWYWNVRFYRVLQEEEYQVRVSPSGQIAGYTHKLPEAKAGATLQQAAAQSLAEDFFIKKLGKDPNEWSFLPEEANSEKKPNRLDWDFTWEKHGLKVKDAPYREKIHVAGDKTTGAEETLQVPEQWKRGYERLRSGNNTLALVFFVIYFGLIGAAVWYAIVFTKQGQTKWGLAIKLGVLAAGLLFLQSLNEWPLWGASYSTKETYAGFVVLQILQALGAAVFTALTITLVLPAAEPLYRNSQPTNLKLSKTFTRRGLRSKEFFSAAVVGISLAAAHIGFVVAFYIIATHYGAWAPQEVNYTDAVNTGFPWISGVAIGLLASMNEEFTFRLFAIPFFTRYTRSRLIAIIVPAFLWGFLHSNYPQEPAYIRGIEVGLIGIVAGFVMLRWGILATLIWHYTVDASLVGLFLVRSDNLYFKISGVIVGLAAAAPLLFSLASYLKRGEFEAVEDLQNGAEVQPEVAVETIEQPVAESQPEVAAEATEQPVAQTTFDSRYQPLSGKALVALGVCLVLGAVATLKMDHERVGDYLKLNINARDAATLANKALRKNGVDPAAYHHATLFLDNSDAAANEFLREKIGVSAINKVYESQIPIPLWGTRYFKDSDPEEYFVVLKSDGSLHSIHHTLAEGAPGASLTKDEAVALAEKYLREQKNLDLAQWSLVDSNSKKQPHRIDHTLTWQQTAPLDPGNDANGHAFERVDLKVIGNEVSWYRTYVKIPDEWSRKQEEQGLSRTLFLVAKILAYIALGAAMFIIFFKNFRTADANAIPWKRISRWTLWSFAGYILAMGFGDRFAQLQQQYQTAVPLKATYLIAAIFALLGVAAGVGGLVFVFGVAWFYCRRAFGEERLPGWAGMPGAYYRDALFVGVGGLAALIGLQGALGWAAAHWQTTHRFLPAAFGSDFSAKLPAASVIGAAISHALLYSALLAAIAGFVAVYIKPLALRLLIFLAGAATLVGDWGSTSDFLEKYFASCILLGVIVVGVRWIAKFNLLGIFLVFMGASLLPAALVLLKQEDAFYRLNAHTILTGLLILFGWPLLKWQFFPSGHTPSEPIQGNPE